MSHFKSLAALDATVFQELLASLSEPRAVAGVYRKFVESANSFIRELHDQEIAARVETLHTLKGSAAMMGATSMAKLAADLQAQAESVQVAQAMQALHAELMRFRTAAAAQLLALGASLDISEQ
ncbi:MAG: Hpt domain-containing protein [Steroidobacter sp.]